MVKAPASRAVDSGLIPSRVKPMNLKLAFTASLFDVQITRTVLKACRQAYLLCDWERHFAGFAHLGVVDNWLATPERARYSALIALHTANTVSTFQVSSVPLM